MFFISREITLGEPPPQMMECIIDVLDWFIPEYPQFLKQSTLNDVCGNKSTKRKRKKIQKK